MRHRPASYPPGQHGQRPGRSTSDYGIQLREKQKVKRIYGLPKTSFAGPSPEAAPPEGHDGRTILRLAQARLDNVVYRLGFSSSRSEARQLVQHSHFLVNGRKVNIPSFECRRGA